MIGTTQKLCRGALTRDLQARNQDEIMLKPSNAMRYLGYYTDAGAYYYYNTEEDLNYDETFEFIRDYVERTKYPIKFRHGIFLNDRPFLIKPSDSR